MDCPREFEKVKQALATSSMFEIEVGTGAKKLVARRQRKFAPRRGAFRLLLPHSLVIVTPGKQSGQRAQYLVRPDSLAIFLTVIFMGAIAVELFMDRSTYPRDYPPAAVYGLTVYYLGFLMAEIIYTHKQLRQVFKQIKG